MLVFRTVHIVAGMMGLVTGTIALYAMKGAPLHRKSGLAFVVALVTMSTTGALMALSGGPDANALGGFAALYLVITAFTTVRRPTAMTRRVDLAAIVLGVGFGLVSLRLAFRTIVGPEHVVDGVPAPIFIMFGAVGLLGSLGDFRMMRTGPLRGAPRLVRHLWRMCWALWIAVSSFFLPPGRVARIVGDTLAVPALLPLPVLAVFVILLYWLWRVQFKKSLRGLALSSFRAEPPSN